MIHRDPSLLLLLWGLTLVGFHILLGTIGIGIFLAATGIFLLCIE